jgi:hypothetical protein
MKLHAILVMLAVPAAGRAGTTLEEYGAGGTGTLRPAEQLTATCAIEVDIRGALAVVDMQEKIANPGPLTVAASLTFELPRGAQLIDASVAGHHAIAVAASHAMKLTDDSDVLGPDPAIVETIGRGDGPRYRALLSPIASGDETTLTSRYEVAAEIHGSALHFALPAHPGCRAKVHATPGPGARFGTPRVAGADATGWVAIDGSSFAIDLDVAIAGNEPVVWTQSEAIETRWNAALVTVLAPAPRARAAVKHAVVVIDASRSMELVGRDRVAKVVRAVMGALPGDLDVDAILYDRNAHRVLGELRPNVAATTDAIVHALAQSSPGNGSDAAGAFALAHQALAGVAGPSIVIAIGDGVVGDVAIDAVARTFDGSEVELHQIVLDPARTRSPGVAALRAAVDAHGGSVVEISADELDHALVAIDDWLRPGFLELGLDDVRIPDDVLAGGGFVQAIVYRDGHAPKLLTGHHGTAFRVPVQRAAAAPVAQLALAELGAIAFASDPDDAREMGRA